MLSTRLHIMTLESSRQADWTPPPLLGQRSGILLGPLPCVLEEVICHPRVTLRSQAASETHGTTTTYNYRPASSSFFFFGEFRVPGLIPCQHPVICNRKREGSQTGSKNIKSQDLGFRLPSRLGIGWKERVVIVKEWRGREGPAPTIPIRSLFEEWLLPKVSVSRQVSEIQRFTFPQ